VANVNAAPLVLVFIVTLLLGLLGWGLSRLWRHAGPEASWETPDDVLLALMVLSAFAAGAFLTFLVMGLV
jgi:hypothetical protein